MEAGIKRPSRVQQGQCSIQTVPPTERVQPKKQVIESSIDAKLAKKMKQVLSAGAASLSLALATLLSPISAVAQGSPITDAYRQLRLLSSETEAGVSYVGYMSKWREVLGFVNIALEDGKPGPLTKQLRKIKTTYTDAAELWKCTIEYGKFATTHLLCLSDGFKSRNTEIAGDIEKVKNNPMCSYGTCLPGESKIEGKVGVRLLFGIASAQIKELGSLLKKK